MGLNCGAVLLPHTGIWISAVLVAAGAADVDAIFTWLTGGNLVDNRMNDGFCGGFDNGFGIELLDNVFFNSDDV